MTKVKQAAWSSSVADDGCILPYIAAFHRLREKAEQGRGLTMEEGRILANLLSMFERRQVAEGRLVRSPVKLRLDRAARFAAGDPVWQGTVREANLRHVSVVFAEPPPVGLAGALEIDGVGDTKWRFDARITRSDPGKTILELGSTLGQGDFVWQAA